MQAVEHFIKQFVPEHYDLFLDLSRETKTFSGKVTITGQAKSDRICLLYTSPSPRDTERSRMPSSA